MNHIKEFEKWWGQHYVEYLGIPMTHTMALHLWEQAALKTTPEVWEECGECGGDRYFKDYEIHMGPKGPFISEDFNYIECESCHGYGKVPKYWTPEMMKEAGFEVLDTDPVWIFVHGWLLREYYAYQYLKGCPIIMAFPGQPKPPKDWRPE